MTKKLLAGKYEVLERFGSSSLATVYRCRSAERREVFVNVLFDEVSSDEEALRSVEDVIERARTVQHPNFITIYEYLSEAECALFSTEAVAGTLLSDYIDESSPSDQNAVIEILHNVLSALEAIHNAGIIHRSIIPEGIIIREDGSAKIFAVPTPDLLVAPKISEDSPADGILDCVAPECIETGVADCRSDLYALGVIAYRLLTGCRPFEGKSFVHCLTARLTDSPRPPEELREECLPELSEIVLKALSRSPDDRFQSAREMKEALERRVLARH